MDGILSFQELEPNTTIPDLIQYIHTEIGNFTGSTKSILIKKKNENQYTTAFCVYMTNTCQAAFNFQGQNAQKGSHSVDIAVYKGNNLVFTIEAKVLPTPKGSKSNPRHEYEYVYGKGGGISRFKEIKHGVDNEDKSFIENGMIAYVKESKFEHWLKKINQWILDASWNSSEQLQKITLKPTAQLISEHSRIDDTKVILHHFWVYV